MSGAIKKNVSFGLSGLCLLNIVLMVLALVAALGSKVDGVVVVPMVGVSINSIMLLMLTRALSRD
jgi:hypothetical protein